MKTKFYLLLLALAPLAACSTSTDSTTEEEVAREIEQLDSISDLMEESKVELDSIQGELDQMEQLLDSLMQ